MTKDGGTGEVSGNGVMTYKITDRLSCTSSCGACTILIFGAAIQKQEPVKLTAFGYKENTTINLGVNIISIPIGA